VIHAKYMVVDRALLWLGTSNWTGGYLDRSRNVELVLKDRGLVEKLLAVHGQLWDSSYGVPVVAGREYPVPKRR
jgi:hypothetical protein